MHVWVIEGGHNDHVHKPQLLITSLACVDLLKEWAGDVAPFKNLQFVCPRFEGLKKKKKKKSTAESQEAEDFNLKSALLLESFGTKKDS